MTAPPTPPPMSLDVMLSRSWALFRSHPVVALPPVIIILPLVAGALALIVWIALVAIGASTHHASPATVIAPALIGYVAFIVAMLMCSVAAYAAMYGMANALWERGDATIGDAFAAVRASFGTVVVAGIGMFGLALLALLLALPTLFLSFLALPLFTMYVLPAVVAGRRGGFSAIGESIALVRRAFATSAIAALVLFAIQYGISFLSYPFLLPLQMSMVGSSNGDAPLVLPPPPVLISGVAGYVLITLLSLSYQGFHAVAVTGLYRSLVLPGAEPAPATAGGPPLSA